MSKETKAIACAAFAVLCWSTVATSFKFALRYFDHYEMLLVASITALLIFSAAITLQGKWRMAAKLTPKQVVTFALVGLLNPVAYYLVLFKAYALLPAQIAQPVNYAWPIVLLVLLAIFARKPIAPAKYLGMAVSLGGVAVISLGAGAIGQEPISPFGFALAVLSAFLWATYWIVNDRIGNTVDPIVALMMNFLFGSIYLLAGTAVVDVDLSSVPGLAWSAYVGFFEIGLPFIFFGMALKLTSNPALVNQMCYLAPFLSLFIISMVLKEPIVPTTYIGLALIVAGLVFNQYLVKEKPDKASR